MNKPIPIDYLWQYTDRELVRIKLKAWQEQLRCNDCEYNKRNFCHARRSEECPVVHEQLQTLEAALYGLKLFQRR